MRIDLNLGMIDPLRAGETSRSHEAGKKTNSSKADEASLSAGDSKLSGLTASALALPEIRSERVSELRTAIASGTYALEPGAIANAMLNDLF